MKDGWRTPDTLFKQLDDEFHFDIDLCANHTNSKCEIYFRDYLNDVVANNTSSEKMSIRDINLISAEIDTCFMNPPYSNPLPFIKKAWEDSKHCKIVCLLKLDCSTKWWRVFWNFADELVCTDCAASFAILKEDITGVKCQQCGKNTKNKTYLTNNGPKPGCEVRLLPKRVRFDPPIQWVEDGTVWKEGDKWVKECDCYGSGGSVETLLDLKGNACCKKCRGKGYSPLAGPSYSCCLVIMDRRKQ